MPHHKMIRCCLTLALVGGALTCQGAKAETPRKPKAVAPALPPLDLKRIADDEARGIKFSADKRTLVKYNFALPDKEYAIPGGVTAVGEEAFGGIAPAESNELTVTIPSSVTTVGKRAFSAVTKVTVSPDNPRFFTDAAGGLFDRKAKKLLYLPRYFSKVYTLPDGVEVIGEGAFDGCLGLTGVILPASVTTIEEGAFDGVVKVTTPPENQWFFTDTAGALIDRKEKKLLRLPRNFSGAYSIPDGVTAIGKQAFAGCRDLTGATIPAGVKTIGEEAFAGCRELNALTIPPSVTAIGKGAFAGGEKLTGVTVPAGVKTIGRGAFAHCPCEASILLKFPEYRRDAEMETRYANPRPKSAPGIDADR